MSNDQLTLLSNDLLDQVIQKFQVKKVKFALSESQMKALLECAFQTNYKHYLMIRFQLECGLRVGEIAHLRIESLNLKEKDLIIESYIGDRNVSDWSPKTRSGNRIIPLTDDLSKELKRFLGKRTKGYVFLSQKGDNFDETSIIRFINFYAKKSPEIARTIGSHSLRRTFASQLSKKGIPLGKISKILGHKDLKTTFIYLFQIDDRDYNDVRNVIMNMY